MPFKLPVSNTNVKILQIAAIKVPVRKPINGLAFKSLVTSNLNTKVYVFEIFVAKQISINRYLIYVIMRYDTGYQLTNVIYLYIRAIEDD